MLTNKSFFDLNEFGHRDLFDEVNVWEVLKKLKEYIGDQAYPIFGALLKTDMPLPETIVIVDNTLIPASTLSIELGDATKGQIKAYKDGQPLTGASIIMAGAVLSGNQIKIGRNVLIEPGAMIKSPAVIGDFSEVRQGAYMRGYTLIGKRCVVGHTTEVKHSIFLDDAKAGHFAYLGDSILGNNVNLGAGTKLANLRFTGGDVPVRTEAGIISTGLRKLGAIMADSVQTGCNSVTNPGTLLGKKSMIMPNTTAPSGYHPPNSLIR